MLAPEWYPLPGAGMMTNFGMRYNPVFAVASATFFKTLFALLRVS